MKAKILISLLMVRRLHLLWMLWAGIETVPCFAWIPPVTELLNAALGTRGRPPQAALQLQWEHRINIGNHHIIVWRETILSTGHADYLLFFQPSEPQNGEFIEVSGGRYRGSFGVMPERSHVWLSYYTSANQTSFRDRLLLEKFVTVEQLALFKDKPQWDDFPRWDPNESYTRPRGVYYNLFSDGPLVVVEGLHTDEATHQMCFNRSFSALQKLIWVGRDNLSYELSDPSQLLKGYTLPRHAVLRANDLDSVDSSLISAHIVSRLDWTRELQRMRAHRRARGSLDPAIGFVLANR